MDVVVNCGLLTTLKGKSNIFNVVSKLSICTSHAEDDYFKEIVLFKFP